MTTTTAAAGTRSARNRDAPPLAHRVGLAVAAIAWIVTGMLQLTQPQVPLDRLSLIGTTLTFVCGAIIVLRTDNRLIGWLLVIAGVLWPLVMVYFQGGPNPPPQTRVTEFLTTLGDTGYTSLLLLLLVFPTGRFDSRLSRVVGAVVVSPTILLAWEFLHLLGLAGAAPDPPMGLIFAVFTLMLAVRLGMQVRRYRHRPRTEQLQIKWFLVGVSTFLAYPVIFALDLQPGPVADIVTASVLPLAILAAITRYRLYDIDRLISRTVAYGIVVSVLGVLGIGGVAVVTSLLPTQDRLAVALSTVAVVALFDPLRRRVVDVVDRRFDRTRYVARQVVEGFGRDVRDVTDLDEIGVRVRAVIGRTVAPTTVAVWQPASPSRGGRS